jgi:hypothetical protein
LSRLLDLFHLRPCGGRAAAGRKICPDDDDGRAAENSDGNPKTGAYTGAQGAALGVADVACGTRRPGGDAAV